MQTRQQQMLKLCDITSTNLLPRRSSSMILCTSIRKSNLSDLMFPTKIENRFAKKNTPKISHFFGISFAREKCENFREISLLTISTKNAKF